MAALAGGSSASAALVPGDDVTIVFSGGFAFTDTVVDGADSVIANFRIDYNGGEVGTVFDFSSVPEPGFLPGNSFLVDDLDFVGGANLIAFEVLETTLTNVAVELTARSVLFRFDETDQFVGPGTILRGRFITDAAPIPLPGALVLFVVGLSGLAGARLKQMRKALA